MNWLPNTNGVQRMLEDEDYHITDSVLSFVCAFGNKAFGFKEDGEVSKVTVCTLSCSLKLMGHVRVGQETLMKKCCRRGSA